MKATLFLLFFTFILFNATPPVAAQTVDPKLLKRAGGCKATGNKSPQPIVIIKQWHLSPNTKTTEPAAKELPQAANLREIEQQLGKWVESKTVKTLMAEGCEGKLDDSTSFNGWSLTQLRSKAKAPAEFARIVTHPVLKLEARYGDKVDSICGDLKQEINEELLAFSDARAAAGYATRIEQYAGKPLQKTYVEGAIEAYQLPKDSKPEAVIAHLKQELKKLVARIGDLNLKRSQSFASTAMIVVDEPIAMVVGGSHAAEIVQYLEGKSRDCVVYEPVHYAQDEEKLMAELKALLK